MAKSSDPDDRDERDERDDEPDDDAAEEAAEAPKAAKPKNKKGSGKRAKGPPRGDAMVSAPRPQGGSLGKSLVLFLIIIAGLAVAFAFFGQETSGSAPKWKVGDKAQLEITLDPADDTKLACWSSQEIKGLHCAFEAATKGWSKGDATNDATLLRPYTTTDRVQFLGAGLWSQPVLAKATRPKVRFAVKCMYTVAGKVGKLGVRWSGEGAWLPQSDGWYAGTLSNCRLVNP